MIVVALLLSAWVLSGCTTVPVFHETGRPSDTPAWRTETRMQVTWYGAPVGQYPRDVFFWGANGQARCERFRLAHPTYTRPEEVCQPVYGTPGTRLRLGQAQRSRPAAPESEEIYQP